MLVGLPQQISFWIGGYNGAPMSAPEPVPGSIILDLRMPTTDGLGLLERFRAMDGQRQVPVAIDTGDDFLETWSGSPEPCSR